MLKIRFPNSVILTGGISTGKSSVSNLLKLEGFSIIDVDSISRGIFNRDVKIINSLYKDKGYDLDPINKKIDFKRAVFNNGHIRNILEEYMHPKIYDTVMSFCNKYEVDDYPYFIDIPLYFESSRYKDFSNYVVVVYTPRIIQLERLVTRDKITVKEAEDMLSVQIDIEKKKKRADFVIDNSFDLVNLQNECEVVSKFFKNLKNK